MDINKIYNENCLDTMARMPDGFIDLVVTSPPYNINLRIHGDKYTKRSKKENGPCNKYLDFSDDLTPDEYFNFHKKVISELIRVCSGYVFWNIQMITGNKLAFFKLLGEFSENIKEVIIWDKKNAEPAIGDRVLNSQFEFVVVFTGDKVDAMGRQFKTANFGRGELSNLLKLSKVSGNNHKSVNAATFPYYLPGWVIKYFSRENNLIYDPFIGTGTTAIAAHNLKRNWIGSELSKNVVDAAMVNLEPYLKQLTIF